MVAQKINVNATESFHAVAIIATPKGNSLHKIVMQCIYHSDQSTFFYCAVHSFTLPPK